MFILIYCMHVLSYIVHPLLLSQRPDRHEVKMLSNGIETRDGKFPKNIKIILERRKGDIWHPRAIPKKPVLGRILLMARGNEISPAV
jgi:hypothetical protein